jgi:hypothetical protein
MRNTLTLAALFCLATLRLAAQAPDYKDLLNLYVDERYPKLLQKAEAYTLNDKTKKEPLPYLFMSMGFYKVSLRDEYKEKYRNSFQSSLKYLSKYAKFDKDKSEGVEYEDFFSTIRKAIISEAEIMNDQQKYTKSKSLYKSLIDLDANDAGAYIMQGMTFEAMKSKKEAEVAFLAAKELISSGKCSVSDKDQRAFLKTALIDYAGSLNSGGRKSEAREWLDLGKKYFEGDKEYQVNYEAVAG